MNRWSWKWLKVLAESGVCLVAVVEEDRGGVLQYLLLVEVGCAPGKVPLRFCVGELRCRFVEVLACSHGAEM